jgi:hypothetical protein
VRSGPARGPRDWEFDVILFVLLMGFLGGAACGYSFGGLRGALAWAVLLVVCLGVAVAAMGSGVLLVAAYAGGPILVVGGLGIALGARFRPGR